MRSIVSWAIRNTPAMNTLMIAVLVVGAFSLFGLRREVFPEFDLEYVSVAVPYPGAAPSEVEEGICQKIEEAVRSIDGVKEITSTAAEGSGMVLLELTANIPDVQRVLNEVRSEVDSIPSFPELAEDPIVEQITLRKSAIRVGVLGPDDNSSQAQLKLRNTAEKIRDELLLLPSISQVELLGVRDYQIDIEISEDTLRKYGLTLQDVANLVRRQNIELPGGTMRTKSQEVLLRGKSKELVGTEIAKIPLITQPNGVVLTIGDLGTVRDEFDDTTAINLINGRPGMVILVEKVSSEDLLAITDEVKDFVVDAGKPGGYKLPAGFELVTWNDQSIMVRDRLELLGRNGLQGLVLVFVILAIFLELRLAFWVALGIPISILGACAILLGTGNTLNMISMFAFLTALGILVDDAIVVGENVYAHRHAGKSRTQAAIDGTTEVMPSVLASVSTTIIAFVPLMFVPGILGKFLAVMPFAVIVMLIISLIESTLILPCHLAHTDGHDTGRPGRIGRLYRYSQSGKFLLLWTSFGLAAFVAAFMALTKLAASTTITAASLAGVLLLVLLPHLAFVFKRIGDLFGWINEHTSLLLHKFIGHLYQPFLDWALNHRAIIVSSAATMLLLALALEQSGLVPWVAFPKLDGDTIMAIVTYPDGTPAAVSEKAAQRCEASIRKLNEKYAQPGKPLVKLVHRSIGQSNVAGSRGPGMEAAGSNIASVGVELVPAAERNVNSNDLVNEWREVTGEFPGAESVSFKTEAKGPPGGAIEFTLMSAPDRMEDMEKLADLCKAELKKIDGVLDITDDAQPGKWEFQVKVKDEAKALGNTVADLAETVRASYYGQEVMRLQRGRHEVKLMVRYPQEERRSLANFDDIRVRTPGAATRRGGNLRWLQRAAAAFPERPLSELAEVDVQRGYSTIHRLNQQRSITVTADIDEKIANAKEITQKLKTDIVPKLMADGKFDNIRVHWGGMEKDTQESVSGLIVGLLLALAAMFALLTYQFKSYVQPMLIMLIIPFGAIGAILGHLALGLPLTLFSLFGMVALTGVVVNDSIVLIDFINHRIESGMPIRNALLDAGRRRFRPVLLTSLTTIGGLMPLLLERSMQAQVLIPMATSLCFGLMFATIMVLILVPVLYSIYYQWTTPKSMRTEHDEEWTAPPEGETEDIGIEGDDLVQIGGMAAGT